MKGEQERKQWDKQLAMMSSPLACPEEASLKYSKHKQYSGTIIYCRLELQMSHFEYVGVTRPELRQLNQNLGSMIKESFLSALLYNNLAWTMG